MATTSSTLVAGKALAGQDGNRNNGRFSLKAKVITGVAILGCAVALAFGGLQRADSPAQQAQPAAVPGNTALAQTQAGNGYLEFAPGDVSSTATTIPVSNVARTQTEAGAGYLEFQPGEEPIVGTGASNPTAGIGLREYLDGEARGGSLPLSSPTTPPALVFGPQP